MLLRACLALSLLGLGGISASACSGKQKDKAGAERKMGSDEREETPAPASWHARRGEITRIEYHFQDASVPPQDHRSITITVSRDRIDKVVDSYGDLISEEGNAITREQFDGLLAKLVQADIRKQEPTGETAGCTGGTADSLRLQVGDEVLLALSVEDCGGDRSGALAGEIKAVAAHMESMLVPSADESGAPSAPLAKVVGVGVSGPARQYQFAVSIASPDTGCEQYADWWELVRPDGTLVHRRILRHSHVGEQPFERSSGPIAIAASEELIVRAHMHPSGYGGMAYRGSVDKGFAADPALGADFAEGLAGAQPQPGGCAH